MQVFIMRHGDAALDAASDALRPLTERGRSESWDMANWLNDQVDTLDGLLVSPYLRAQQTLEVVRSALSLPETAEVLAELTPGGDPQLVADYLRILAGEGTQSVLVISHLPLVGYLVSALCTEQSPPMFTTSAIACIELDSADARGTLLWQKSPCNLK